MATDYSQLGSFATGGAASLNGELIQKLYDAESVSRVSPIETSLELITTEKEKMTEINTKVNELLEAIKPFDLYAKAGNRAFEQVSASATGTSVLFDAADVSSLKVGSYSVNVTQLAQKDVWQSSTQTIADPPVDMVTQDLTITTDAGTETISTEGLTLQEFADEINTSSQYATASVEQTGDNSYRLILKSKDPGTANALTLGGTAAGTLGFNETIDVKYTSGAIADTDKAVVLTDTQKITINGTEFVSDGTNTISDLVTSINNHSDFSAKINENDEIEIAMSDGSAISGVDFSGISSFDLTTGVSVEKENTNHPLAAQNMNATVDGVLYDVSSNSIQVDGNLRITAAELGTSTLSITKDDSSIIPAVQEMATKYNELLTLVTEELYSDEPSVQDTSTLKDIVNGIKSMIYGEYGEKQGSLLNFGISFDDVGNTGLLEVDTTILGNALLEDPDAVKDLFLGTPKYDVDGTNPIIPDETTIQDERGFGTLLKEHLDSLNSYPDGLFNAYTDNMDARELRLEEEKEKAVETLDTKYDTMAAQFAAYATIISQMESSFAGLKQIIAAENSSD